MRVWKVGGGKGRNTFHTRMLTRGKYGWLASRETIERPRNRLFAWQTAMFGYQTACSLCEQAGLSTRAPNFTFCKRTAGFGDQPAVRMAKGHVLQTAMFGPCSHGKQPVRTKYVIHGAHAPQGTGCVETHGDPADERYPRGRAAISC